MADRGQGRVPPHNLDAEESLLGAMLLSRDSIVMAMDVDLQAEDFYKPAYGTIYFAITDLWRSGEPVDPVTVAEYLRTAGLLEAIGGPGILLTLQAGTPATSNAGRYATIISEHATMRRIVAAGGELAELGYSLPDDVALAVEAAGDIVRRIELPMGTSRISPNITRFLDVEFEYNWLVEGLIEKQDRLILTGGEGGGKSTFFRQIAMTLAAGVHPFRFHPIPPVRVLTVDIENTPAQIQRKLRPLYNIVHGRIDPDNFRIEARTGGIDLLHRADHRWLLELIASNRPELLIIGPVYKLFDGDPNEEAPTRKVQAILDGIRARWGCAVMLEAHSPHGEQGRPSGTSIWKRWPEFGYGIWPIHRGEADDGSVNFLPWRGDRDARQWPSRLERGGLWPWTDPDYHAPEDRF